MKPSTSDKPTIASIYQHLLCLPEPTSLDSNGFLTSIKKVSPGQKYNAAGTIKETSQWYMSTLTAIASSARSVYSQTSQTKELAYCAAVPLYLAAMKESYGIKYSEWDLSNQSFFMIAMGYSLGTAIMTSPIELVQAAIAELKGHFPTMNDARNIAKGATSYTIRAIPNCPIFNSLDKLVRMMLLRLWIFEKPPHPNMIVRFEDYDSNEPYFRHTSPEAINISSFWETD